MSKLLNAWQMLDDNEIVSQFDRNFACPVKQDEIADKIGLTYHHVKI